MLSIKAYHTIFPMEQRQSFINQWFSLLITMQVRSQWSCKKNILSLVWISAIKILPAPTSCNTILIEHSQLESPHVCTVKISIWLLRNFLLSHATLQGIGKLFVLFYTRIFMSPCKKPGHKDLDFRHTNDSNKNDCIWILTNPLTKRSK